MYDIKDGNIPYYHYLYERIRQTCRKNNIQHIYTPIQKYVRKPNETGYESEILTACNYIAWFDIEDTSYFQEVYIEYIYEFWRLNLAQISAMTYSRCRVWNKFTIGFLLHFCSIRWQFDLIWYSECMDNYMLKYLFSFCLISNGANKNNFFVSQCISVSPTRTYYSLNCIHENALSIWVQSFREFLKNSDNVCSIEKFHSLWICWEWILFP